MSTSLNSDAISPEKAQIGSVSGGGQTPTIGGGSGSEEGGDRGSSTNLSSTVSAISPSSSQFQRLKVEDALSYLDQVKLQFGSHPQVYNDFLDIMKEFKSQSIDTPGVISRVSNLFKGHPDLIVGFNTFLPPGFKIEVHGQNEINIHGPAQHTQTLQQIAMRHNSQAQAAAAAAAANNSSQTGSRSSFSGTKPGGTQGNNTKPHGHQPVEFNHAINYVNKIKNRFQGQPDVYKAFLEILHTYQKEQRLMKDGNGPVSAPIPLTETEVYGQVSKLFQNQEDLLSEFGQFLPDATASHQLASLMGSATTHSKKQTFGKSKSHSRKSSQSNSSNNNGPPSKRMKSSAKDVLAEAGRHSSYSEMALFDKIRKCLNTEVYDNFLRCLALFNEEIVSRHDLVQLITPFLGKYPDLFCQFKNLLGFKEPSTADLSPENTPPPQFPNKDRSTEFAAEIDFNSLKRHGTSYRALPKTYVQPKCSGRTPLCKGVLNDTWVSFPMWSEDSTFHGTRKTQYEEYIFRCEDERFELDIVLENNLSTIKILETVHKKLEKMSPEEISSFILTDALGGFSETIHRKSIYRIYGEKAIDIIEGIKKNPAIGVPPVLKRLKAKQEEWYEAQKQFNKIWREQLEKYYLKSLDHQGINFKATDTRNMRSKSLIGEVEALYDERQEQMMDGKTAIPGPHIFFNLPCTSSVHSDAVSLVIYYMKRASSLSKEDSTKIKTFLTCTLSDFCYYERVNLSSDDDLSIESDSDNMEVDQDIVKDLSNIQGDGDSSTTNTKPPEQNTCLHVHPDIPPHYSDMEKHTMFTNNTIYSFYRLFEFLWERLNKLYQQSLLAIEDGLIDSGNSLQESVAIRLGLKKLPEIQVDEYYPTFLTMAKNYMEGNIDCTTYEDTCREMFGVQAYLAFTLDRLVQNIVRQLHTVVADEICLKLMEHYTSYVEGLSDVLSTPALMAAETQYQKKVEGLLNDENSYKVIVTSNKLLSIELLESEESCDDNGTESKKWSAYIEQYCKDEPPSDQSLRQLLQSRKIFLRRNHRKPSLLSSAMSSPSSEDNEKTEKDIDTFLMQFDTHGELEFKMDERTYRMIPLANSGDYLYKRDSLATASRVNASVFTRQKKQYGAWYDNWCTSNPPPTDGVSNEQQCNEWLLGITNDTSNVITERNTEEYNGQMRYRYTTNTRNDE